MRIKERIAIYFSTSQYGGDLNNDTLMTTDTTLDLQEKVVCQVCITSLG